MNAVAIARYWHDVSECDCDSSLPHGGCLKCDMAKLLKHAAPESELARERTLQLEPEDTNASLVELVAAVLKRGGRDATDISALDRIKELHAAERERDEALEKIRKLEVENDHNWQANEFAEVAFKERDEALALSELCRRDLQKLREAGDQMAEALQNVADTSSSTRLVRLAKNSLKSWKGLQLPETKKNENQ